MVGKALYGRVAGIATLLLFSITVYVVAIFVVYPADSKASAIVQMTVATLIPADTNTPMPPSPTPYTCELIGTVVDTPNVGINHNDLNAVDALSANNVWAVGEYEVTNNRTNTLIMHWDGISWTIVPSPSLAGFYNYLLGVDAISANDVWAVGWAMNNTPKETLILHWNGNVWTIVPSSNHGSSSELNAVAGTASDDVWAVGTWTYPGHGRALALHWDGALWNVVDTPAFDGVYDHFYGVTALAPDDVWATGTWGDNPLVEHWDGTSWTVSRSDPVAPGRDHSLRGISASGPNDIWAAGWHRNLNVFEPDLAFILHYDGTTWTYTDLPGHGGEGDYLWAVDARTSSDVWVVGISSPDTSEVLAAHFDGSAWSYVPIQGGGTYFYGVASVGANDAWGVGDLFNGQRQVTLAVRMNYPCLQGTPTSTATVTPTATGTATSTRSATLTQTPTNTATATATATATTCTLQFQDVPPDSTFYSFVRCMACRGIVNGYPCGGEGEPCGGTGDPYFRPGNNVTRGQISKIVSNAAGFTEPVTGQTFEDVPVGSTFYEFVQRLTDREIMSGYPCGNPEPCVAPGNRPYFRPGANATRGQLAKIVSNAAELQDPVTGQTFEDVLPGSTFYDFIERLVGLGAMSGYPCGNPEPCIAPGNRPYFRPANNVTRGQTSKIVANTFFPGCAPTR